MHPRTTDQTGSLLQLPRGAPALLQLWPIFVPLLILLIPPACAAQAVEVVPPDLRGARQPQVAVSLQGRIFVAFGKENQILCATSADGGKTFSAAREVARVPKLTLGMRRGP